MKKLLFRLFLTLIGTLNVAADPAYCKTVEECQAGCDKKDAEGCDRLSDMYQTGSKIAMDPEKAFQYRLLACEYDDAYRCLIAGWSLQYPYSEKMKSDLKQAEVFYQKACDKGDKRGCEFILAMKEGHAAKPDKDGTRPPVPALLCNDPILTAIEPGSDPPRKKIISGQIDEPPKLLKEVKPLYPEAERRNDRTGKVFLQVVIGEHGEIVSGRVFKAESLLFEQAAEAAVKQWQYSPPRHCGKPVSVYKMVMVNFKLH